MMARRHRADELARGTDPVSNSMTFSQKPLGLVWISCDPHSMVSIGLRRTLEERARVHMGGQNGNGAPSSIVLCSDGTESISDSVGRIKDQHPGASVLVFGLHEDLPLAQAALRAGARGFIHAGMRPEQLLRAVEVAAEGEIVAPRRLLEYLITHEEHTDFGALTARQRETLSLVVEGLSNAEVGRRLYLSESTIKQHLRAAYKALNVSNRTEAAKLIRDSS
jgi:DNA-binding NarL/FixJ family response regulator